MVKCIKKKVIKKEQTNDAKREITSWKAASKFLAVNLK